MAHVNEASQSRYITSHQTFIHKWNEPSCLCLLSAEQQRTLAGSHFPFRWG